MAAASPSVSCVLVTKDRRLFAQQALRYIQAQSVRAIQIVVVDTSARSRFDEVERHRWPQVSALGGLRVIHAPGLPVGSARNIGHEAAVGDIVVHWDDDDFYSPWRVERQLQALRHGNVTACDRCLVYDLVTRRGFHHANCSAAPFYFSAGTIAYWRAEMPDPPFLPLPLGEDDKFFQREAPRLVSSLLEDDYVYLRHRTNASMMRESDDPSDCTAKVHAILGPHLAFYEDIAELLPATPDRLLPDLRAEMRRAFER
jgi:glycosyltransferase involved in cell wall biosynthesis